MLVLSLRVSLLAFSFRLLCHGAAVWAVLLSALSVPFAALLIAGILFSGARLLTQLHRDLRHKSSRLTITAQGCRLQQRERILECLEPNALFVSEFLIILQLPMIPPLGRGPVAAERLVIFPDSITTNERRKLRRYLKFERSRRA